MDKFKTNTLFPIETINRELDFRLFLAVMAANSSHRIFVGQHNVLDKLIPYMKGGIYVGKTLFKTSFPTDLSYYRLLKKQGFSIVHLDEEGAFYAGDEDNWRRVLDIRLDPSVLKRDDFICTWGDFQKKHYISKNPELAQNIRVTGHPRFDLYKKIYRHYFEQEAKLIKEKYGHYILINTNLTTANNGFGLRITFSSQYGYLPKDQNKRMSVVRRWAQANHVLSNMVALIHRLSFEFPDFSIVVRPHPSEEQNFYRTVFSGVENIHVVHSGPVGHWIVAAEVLIHDGCTTAVEAYLADTQIISFKPYENDQESFNLPNLLGNICSTEEKVVALIKKIQAGESIKWENNIGQKEFGLFENFSSEAFKPVLNVIEEAQTKLSSNFKTPSLTTLRLMENSRQIKDVPKKVFRPFFSEKMANYRTCYNKFYGFDKKVIQQKMDLIQKMLDKSVNFSLISDSLMIIDSKEQ
ncbi:hypothetical protein QUF90_13740 [Desulfococcaceae bacterium HSG9]|nr:hypothetical protein [Desulfococcaceae bacterium HSG9]